MVRRDQTISNTSKIPVENDFAMLFKVLLADSKSLTTKVVALDLAPASPTLSPRSPEVPGESECSPLPAVWRSAVDSGAGINDLQADALVDC